MKRVLFATRDLETRATVATWLVDAGFAVNECRSGLELAWRLDAVLSAPRPGLQVDVVLCDARMPGINGLDVLEDLQGLPSPLPVVLLTELDDRLAQQLGRRMGAAAVLSKPFTADRLLSAVGGAVGGRN